jgi:hypothetical protein
MLFNINSNAVDMKYKIDAVNSNLVTTIDKISATNDKLDSVNIRLDVISESIILGNKRVGFIVFGLCFVALMVIGWLTFKNVVYYPFKNVLRHVM